MGFSTHVLDLSAGRPAAGVDVTLEQLDGDAWSPVAAGATDADGRVGGMLSDDELQAGVYRVSFATGAWFAARGERTFWPQVRIEFEVHDERQHHHVPLLLSPWGYSTYRGS